LSDPCLEGLSHGNVTVSQLQMGEYALRQCSVCGKKIRYPNKSGVCRPCYIHFEFGKRVHARSMVREDVAEGKAWTVVDPAMLKEWNRE